MVADDAPDVGGTGRGGPADPGVPRRQPPGRGPEANAAKDAVTRRTDPIADLPAGWPRPAPRMAVRHHRLPQPPVAGTTHRIKPDRAEILQRTGHRRVRNVRVRDRRNSGWVRNSAGRRKLQPQPRRQDRQRLRRR